MPVQKDIVVDYQPGETITVELHDGSLIRLKKLDRDYNPADRTAAVAMLDEAKGGEALATGILYYDPDRPSLQEMENLIDSPLVHLESEQLRPNQDSLIKIMEGMRGRIRSGD